jgi:putative tryptophan/tyrosine transport system substrate-binding protein
MPAYHISRCSIAAIYTIKPFRPSNPLPICAAFHCGAWGAGSVDRMQLVAKELVGLNADVLVAITTPATAALQAETHSIPIVFAVVSDPVGSGFAASLAKPGGNITGFIDIEGSLGGKWLELIHEVAPSASRVAFLFNPQAAPFARYYLDTFRSSAAALNIEPIESAVHAAAEVEAAMTKLGREGGVGIIVMPETSTGDYGEAIISLADRYLCPRSIRLAFLSPPAA